MIHALTNDHAEEWDDLVGSFRDHDAYWLSGYSRAFELHGDGTPLLLHYDDGETRGVSVVMRRDIADDPLFAGRIPRNTCFDLATPYGYGGWLIEGSGGAELFAAYDRWAHKTGVISEFVRFHPMARNHIRCSGFYDVMTLGEVVHMDLTSPKEVWANLDTKNRNMIRKAKKNGVRVYHGSYPEIYEVFRSIYDATMEHNDAREWYYFGEDFYSSVLSDLKSNAEVFYAVFGDEVVAASIFLSGNGRMSYHLSGSKLAYRKVAPTNLIIYEAALWGCANGCRTLNLGGGLGSGEDELFRFKRKFYKGDLTRFHVGRRVFDEETYHRLVGLSGVEDTGYFPAYRAPGNT